MITATSLKFTRQHRIWFLTVTANNETDRTVWRTLADAKGYAQRHYTLPKQSPKGFTQVAAQMQ